MNIVVHNHRDLEFDLADLDLIIKDYIEESGAIVSLVIPSIYFNLYYLYIVLLN